MKYKLMAVDMDGTLLNPDSEITAFTRQTVKKAVAQGLKFVLCNYIQRCCYCPQQDR